MKRAAVHPTRSIGFLSRLHDGELTDAERRDFELHAGECSECAAAAAEFEAVLDLYRRAQTELPDPALAGRIARRIDARLRWRPPVRYVKLEIDLLWASVVATCLVGVLAVYNLRSLRTPPAAVSMVAETSSPVSPSAPAPESLRDEPVPRRATGPRPRPAGRRADSREDAPEARAAAPAPLAQVPAPEAEAAPSPGAPASAAAPEPVPAPSIAPARPESADALLRDEARSGPTTAPVLIRRVEPMLPDANRRLLRSKGPFTVEAVITENGDVDSIRISPPAPPVLEGPIVAALREWKYRPALRDGRAVPARLSVVIYVNRK